jgi:membrane protein
MAKKPTDAADSGREELEQLRKMPRVPLSEWIYMIREAGNEWLDDQAQRLGASLAFYTLLSLAPLLVITVALAGLVFGREAANGQLAWQIQNLVGLDEARGLQAIIQSAQRPAVGLFATVLSIATLVFSASSAAADLQDALNIIWHVPSPSCQGLFANVIRFVKSRFYPLMIVLGGGVLLVASLAFSTLIAALGKLFHSFRIPEATLHAGVFVLSFLVITAIFAAIYKILPNVRLTWTDVLVGACVSSLLFTIGKQLIALYLGKVGVASAYGAAGSLVVVLIWVYYSAQLFFLGAEFTKIYARTRGSHRPAKESASNLRDAASLPRN